MKITESDRKRRSKSCSERNFKHGKVGSKIYKVWKNMKNRCTNPRTADYKRYGARGIQICKEWLEFKNFYSDMGNVPSGMTLDRINNDDGYYKENCRWASRKTQAINRTLDPTKWKGAVTYTVNGETMILPQWARRFNIKVSTLKARIKNGWSMKRAVETPIKNRK